MGGNLYLDPVKPGSKQIGQDIPKHVSCTTRSPGLSERAVPSSFGPAIVIPWKALMEMKTIL
jgi:hypothetical protein